jgi:sulfate/thiosulfate transport system ATP-binding protein
MYVELKNINKTFHNYKASDHVNFGIEQGKLIGLLGPSGSGKTTILRMIAGLEQPDSGDIFINQKRVNDIPASKRGIGFVFQSYALFRYMDVFDNIAFGLEIQKKNKKEIKERVLELIKLIGLEGLEHRYPNQLSGGQRQRVAFARALAPNPQLLLLDEPFAAIDAKVRQELRSWLKEMISRVGITSIFVTHDQDEAIEVADEIIITNQGRVEQMGSPVDIYKKPATPFVAQFIGQSSLVDDYTSLIGFDKVEAMHQAVIRPEFIRIAKQGELKQYLSAAEEGIVESVSFRGNNLEVKVRVKGQSFTATRSLEKEEVEVGEKVNILVYRLYAFDDNRTYLLENKAMEDRNPVFI